MANNDKNDQEELKVIALRAMSKNETVFKRLSEI